MKKSILLVALVFLVVGTSCASSSVDKEINEAIDESKKASEEIAEISKDLKEVEAEVNSKFDNNSNKDLTDFSKDDELEEGEKDLEDNDDDSEINEPEDPKDLGILSYKGVYMGTWITQQGFAALTSMTVSGSTVTGTADFHMSVPGGESNSIIMFSGTIDDEGTMEGILTGTGVLTGNNMASTMEMTGTFLGTIKEDNMTISYESTALTYIKSYGTITNKDGGIIHLEKTPS